MDGKCEALVDVWLRSSELNEVSLVLCTSGEADMDWRPVRSKVTLRSTASL